MKSDINKININIECNNSKSLKEALDKLVEDFNNGLIKQSVSGGDYFKMDYVITRELNSIKTDVNEPIIPLKPNIDEIDLKVNNDSIRFVNNEEKIECIIPSRLNYM
jgi:hypothetical protein